MKGKHIMDKKEIIGGTIEYKMPKEMANMYLKTAKGEFAKKHPQEYLIKVVNEEFGVKGTCINVITF